MAYALTDESEKLRPYQRNALNVALSNEGVVLALPTGTGKTLVACAWACELLNQRAAKRILVLEPSRFLVEQNCAYFSKHTDIPTSKVYGTTPPEERVAVWRNQTYRAIVTTAQTALNDIDLLDFDAVIVDECHHTTGEHVYHQLLRWDLFTPLLFQHRLGLSATIPERLRYHVETSIGPVHSWRWTDPEIVPYVPPWYWEVYDTELKGEERRIVDVLEHIQRESSGSERWLASIALRMFVRDGALALEDTGKRGGRLARLLGFSYQMTFDDLNNNVESTNRGWSIVAELLESKQCRRLHKLEQLRTVLASHDFDKAVVFVDRVVIARALEEEFAQLDPVLLLGRLHGGAEAQKMALEEIRRPETKLLVSTSAGEEGLDVPEVDMVVTWSNTANPVRFIQRMGRSMRAAKTSEGRRPKVNVFLATPDTPDYDSLYQGIVRAEAAGLEYSLANREPSCRGRLEEKNTV